MADGRARVLPRVEGLVPLLAASLVWFAHIGMGRALGYGLEHDTGSTHTHLGRTGR